MRNVFSLFDNCVSLYTTFLTISLHTIDEITVSDLEY